MSGPPFDPSNQDVKINTEFSRKDRVFNISVAMHSLDTLTAKQADIYLKGLIAQALKTAVMENYASIQRLVDEAIHAEDMKAKIEAVVLEEFRLKAQQSIKDMFG